METKIPYGKFVWHELMTTDIAAARKFYAALFSWNIQEVEMGPEKYNLIRASDRDIGGILSQRGPAPSAWVGYVTVAQVDTVTERAGRLGGKVLMPPTDIPQTGRFSIVEDAQGAVSAPFQYGEEKPKEDQMGPGMFCWDEILTPDPAKAAAFYGELYGWSTGEMDMGPMGKYTIFRSGDKDRAGAMLMPTDAQAPPHWLSYVFVEDVDASFKRAAELGGTHHLPPMDVPNIGRMAIVGDPTGGVIGLFTEPKKSA